MWPFRSTPEAKAAPAVTERATLASPDDELMQILTGGFGVGTASGERVGPNSALQVPALLAAIRSISETCASLDVRVVRVGPNGVRETDDEHSANRVLQHPNPWTGRYSLMRDLCSDACRHGVGYAVANRINGKVRELHRIQPGQLACDMNLSTMEPNYRLGSRGYGFRDVVHLQPLTSDNGELRSLVGLAREPIGFAMTLQRHGSRLFSQGAKPGGLLSVKPAAGSNVVAPQTLKNIAEVWNKTFGGGGNSGKTAALPGDVSYQSLSLNSVDAQYLELWRHVILQIAAAFRVPPQFLADLTRTTHSNAEELSLQFVAFCIKPWCDMLTEALERVLFTEEERQTHFIEFDFSDILRPNTLQLFDAMTKAVSGGVLTPDDARQYVGKAPVPGGADLRIPLNTARATDPSPAAPDVAPEPPAEPPAPEATP